MMYLLSYDPYKVDASALHQVIDSSPYIRSWSHYIGSSYLIKSDHSVSHIVEDINARWPNQRYLLIKIDPYNYGGLLPRKAWDWIKRKR